MAETAKPDHGHPYIHNNVVWEHKQIPKVLQIAAKVLQIVVKVIQIVLKVIQTALKVLQNDIPGVT